MTQPALMCAFNVPRQRIAICFVWKSDPSGTVVSVPERRTQTQILHKPWQFLRTLPLTFAYEIAAMIGNAGLPLAARGVRRWTASRSHVEDRGKAAGVGDGDPGGRQRLGRDGWYVLIGTGTRR